MCAVPANESTVVYDGVPGAVSQGRDFKHIYSEVQLTAFSSGESLLSMYAWWV